MIALCRSVPKLDGRREGPSLHGAGEGGPALQEPAWSADAPFDLIKQVYLVTSDSIQGLAREVSGLDAQTARKVEFYTRQLVDALSPSSRAESVRSWLTFSARKN